MTNQIAQADAAPPPDPTVGGVGPYQPQKTNVQMMSETVLIDVRSSPSNLEEPKQIKVNASFTMRNQGQTEEPMQVIFPLTRLNTGGTEEALYQIDVSSFAIAVNGQSVPFATITTPPEVTASDMEHGFGPEVQWAAFEVNFPVRKMFYFKWNTKWSTPMGNSGKGLPVSLIFASRGQDGMEKFYPPTLPYVFLIQRRRRRSGGQIPVMSFWATRCGGS
jgi:hypothetical protein